MVERSRSSDNHGWCEFIQLVQVSSYTANSPVAYTELLCACLLMLHGESFFFSDMISCIMERTMS